MRSALTLCLFLLVGSLTCFAQDGMEDEMKAFPPAAKGWVRHVWYPPALDNENEARVQIIVGRMAEVDDTNHHSLVGTITEETIRGWGYPRYTVRSTGKILGTLIGVPSGSPRISKFVVLHGGPRLFDYNSRLPVVVYAPKGLIVKIRVWRPSGRAVESRVV